MPPPRRRAESPPARSGTLRQKADKGSRRPQKRRCQRPRYTPQCETGSAPVVTAADADSWEVPRLKLLSVIVIRIVGISKTRQLFAGNFASAGPLDSAFLFSKKRRPNPTNWQSACLMG